MIPPEHSQPTGIATPNAPDDVARTAEDTVAGNTAADKERSSEAARAVAAADHNILAQNALQGTCNPAVGGGAAGTQSMEGCITSQTAAPCDLWQADVEAQRCDRAARHKGDSRERKPAAADCERSEKGARLDRARSIGSDVCDAKEERTLRHGRAHSSTSTFQPSPDEDGLGPLHALRGPAIPADDDLSALRRLRHLAVESRGAAEDTGLFSPEEGGRRRREPASRRFKRKRVPNTFRSNALCAPCQLPVLVQCCRRCR